MVLHVQRGVKRWSSNTWSSNTSSSPAAPACRLRSTLRSTRMLVPMRCSCVPPAILLTPPRRRRGPAPPRGAWGRGSWCGACRRVVGLHIQPALERQCNSRRGAGGLLPAPHRLACTQTKARRERTGRWRRRWDSCARAPAWCRSGCAACRGHRKSRLQCRTLGRCSTRTVGRATTVRQQVRQQDSTRRSGSAPLPFSPRLVVGCGRHGVAIVAAARARCDLQALPVALGLARLGCRLLRHTAQRRCRCVCWRCWRCRGLRLALGLLLLGPLLAQPLRLSRRGARHPAWARTGGTAHQLTALVVQKQPPASWAGVRRAGGPLTRWRRWWRGRRHRPRRRGRAPRGRAPRWTPCGGAGRG